MPLDPQIVRRDKSSKHVRQPGEIYQGIVTSTRDDGNIYVKIPSLSITSGPVMPLNSSSSNRLSVGDIVACSFNNSYNSSLVVFGKAIQSADDYSISRYTNTAERDSSIISPQEGRVVYILDSDELQIYNGTSWITVIDTGESENLSIETLSVSQTSTFGGDLTVDTDVLKVDTSTNRVGIGTSSPTVELDIVGDAAISGNISVSGDASISGLFTLQEVSETVTATSVSASVMTVSLNNGCVFNQTSALASNFTIDITNVPTTTNRAITVTLIVLQGATAFIPNALKIDGVSQTIKWAQGATPTGTANKYDIFTWTLLRTSAGAWVVFGNANTNF